MGRITAHLMKGSVVLEAVRVNSRSRIAHVGKIAYVFMNAKVEH